MAGSETVPERTAGQERGHPAALDVRADSSPQTHAILAAGEEEQSLRGCLPTAGSRDIWVFSGLI